VAAVVVVLLATLAVVAVTTRDDRPRAAPGEQVDPQRSRLPGHDADLELVGGPVSVTVSETFEELPWCCEDDARAPVRPPDGGTFVGVAVEPDPTLAPPGSGIPVVELNEVPAPTYALVVRGPGGEEDDYPLNGLATTTGGSTWVAVDGRPAAEDVTLQVTEDGVTQVVHPSEGQVARGDAAGLYEDLADPTRHPCGRVAAPSTFRLGGGGVCSLETWATPYLPGVGWADASEEATGPGPHGWLVVSVDRPSPGPLERRAGSFPYFTELATEPDPPTAVRLDGRRPDRVFTQADFPLVVAWLVDAATYAEGERLDLRVDVPVETLVDPDPVDAVRLRWTRAVPPPR